LVASTGDGDMMARAGFSAADVSAGMFAYSAILNALLLRGRTGKGSRIDVSMLETLAEWMGNPMYFTFDGQPPAPRTGASHPSIAPYGPARAGDGQQLLLSIQNEREWERFCTDVLEDTDLVADPLFANNVERTANRAVLDELITARFAGLTADQAESRLLGAGIATARINSAAALWKHPQLAARERWTSVQSPAGEIPALLPPASNDSYEARMDPVPALGEHTDAVLAELGYDRARIDALHSTGAV
jgi:itaconate CoA-transferase